MPEITNELDDILNSFSEADRPAMREALARNPNAQTLLTSREIVYKAFVDGDPVMMAAATATAVPAAVATVAPPPTIGIGLDQINALLNERVNSIYSSPQFTSAVDTLAEKKAQALFAVERTQIIGRGAAIADEIYTIRATHSREFGEELDRATFEAYYAAEGSKHGNLLTDTYNAFVGEKRIAKRIAEGVQAGLAAQATAIVPGSAVPGVGNPMAPNFVDFNVKTISPNAVAVPSADADKAAQAFASMRQGWTQ